MKTKWLVCFSSVLLIGIQQGFSFYNPSEGRWLSRDPIEEPGSKISRREMANLPGEDPYLYAFVGNAPINTVDAFGLASIPKDAEECYGAHPLYPDDPACEKYGERKYRGVILRCFCRCVLLRDPWSNYVRGCLRCMDEKGVPVSDAHEACYAAADRNWTRPTQALFACYCQCRR